MMIVKIFYPLLLTISVSTLASYASHIKKEDEQEHFFSQQQQISESRNLSDALSNEERAALVFLQQNARTEKIQPISCQAEEQEVGASPSLLPATDNLFKAFDRLIRRKILSYLPYTDICHLSATSQAIKTSISEKSIQEEFLRFFEEVLKTQEIWKFPKFGIKINREEIVEPSLIGASNPFVHAELYIRLKKKIASIHNQALKSEEKEEKRTLRKKFFSGVKKFRSNFRTPNQNSLLLKLDTLEQDVTSLASLNIALCSPLHAFIDQFLNQRNYGSSSSVFEGDLLPYLAALRISENWQEKEISPYFIGAADSKMIEILKESRHEKTKENIRLRVEELTRPHTRIAEVNGQILEGLKSVGYIWGYDFS